MPLDILRAYAAPITVGLMALLVLLAMGKTVRRLLRLLGRTGVGLAGLALFSQAGGFLGISLGVNLFNALILGLLGLPGFGLLLLMNWMLGPV
ncbi:pro-sigmaK processing inhibitor BofA family protein [Pseudoflavonifractor sp. 524-17]|uniref:pro-sigmaK processing inhibitor BofA family protein n=1 Tax=Pseudoflavonifractor sp. 524-17 TaxID=2304577 RepID=UPI001FAE6451|nr:pro-sigmaK processing inhibitor BofA family protein [Pseudoflavonifractor sp. 524-17]